MYHISKEIHIVHNGLQKHGDDGMLLFRPSGLAACFDMKSCCSAPPKVFQGDPSATKRQQQKQKGSHGKNK